MSSTGVVFQYVRRKGFGFILDQETRTQIWFHKSKIHTSADRTEEHQGFAVGEECLFDKSIKRSGKKPGSTHAVNIRTLQGAPFQKGGILDDDIMV